MADTESKALKPKEKKEVLGIDGVLYIDTKQFAITKAIATHLIKSLFKSVSISEILAPFTFRMPISLVLLKAICFEIA